MSLAESSSLVRQAADGYLAINRAFLNSEYEEDSKAHQALERLWVVSSEYLDAAANAHREAINAEMRGGGDGPPKDYYWKLLWPLSVDSAAYLAATDWPTTTHRVLINQLATSLATSEANPGAETTS